jgi:hypothetical protein
MPPTRSSPSFARCIQAHMWLTAYHIRTSTHCVTRRQTKEKVTTTSVTLSYTIAGRDSADGFFFRFMLHGPRGRPPTPGGLRPNMRPETSPGFDPTRPNSQLEQPHQPQPKLQHLEFGSLGTWKCLQSLHYAPL